MLSALNNISTIFYILGLFFYNKYFVNSEAQKVMKISSYIYIFINITFLSVVMKTFSIINNNPFYFCLLNFGFQNFVAEIN